MDKNTATVAWGDFTTLKPVSTPAGTLTNYTWSSDNKAVATVDENGRVFGVAVGTAAITATSDEGLRTSCKVTVKERSAPLELDDYMRSDFDWIASLYGKKKNSDSLRIGPGCMLDRGGYEVSKITLSKEAGRRYSLSGFCPGEPMDKAVEKLTDLGWIVKSSSATKANLRYEADVYRDGICYYTFQMEFWLECDGDGLLTQLIKADDSYEFPDD